MKRFLLRIIKLILIILLTIDLLLIGIYIYHYKCNKEIESIIKIPGELIEVYDKEYIHAYMNGEGEYTIVMLPGMGTPSPYYDFLPLSDSLSKDNRVLIIEPLGYGFSSITKKERTLENYYYEINKVLEHYNIKDNIILLSHSYSGVISLRYANDNMDKVKGLVCLDCTSSYQVEAHKNEDYVGLGQLEKFSYKMLARSGLIRIADMIYPKIYNSLLKDNYLNEEQIKIYKYLIYNMTANDTVLNEVDSFPKISLDSLYKPYNDKLYVETFLSYDTIKSMKKDYEEGYFLRDFETMHSLLITNKEIQHIHKLYGDHYIHHNNVNNIAKIINDMIKNF